jgi:hypothetical protein
MLSRGLHFASESTAPVDRLLVGEIRSERYPVLDRFGGGHVY